MELIERLEKAAGPDRRLDIEIGCVVSNLNTDHFRPVLESVGSIGDEWSEEEWPRYTASLDAAMTLVPDGWFTDLSISPAGTSCSADLTANDGKFLQQGDTETHGAAITAPLALCIAALKARAA